MEDEPATPEDRPESPSGQGANASGSADDGAPADPDDFGGFDRLKEHSGRELSPEAAASADELVSRGGCMRIGAMGFVTVTIVAVVAFLFVEDTDDDPATVNTVDAVADEAADVETPVGDLGVDTADAAASDDAVDETDDAVDETDVAGDETDDTDASSVDVPDDLVRPQAYDALTDAEGQLWLRIRFYAQWGLLPPEFFSGFGSWTLTWNPTTEVGWETHNGADIVLGTTSEAFILEDGTVVFASGLFPVEPYVLSIDARFGSWPDEAGPPAVFGEDSASIDSELIGEGDPLVDFGAVPVFDLVAGN